jgi:hypothetical protein
MKNNEVKGGDVETDLRLVRQCVGTIKLMVL